MIGDVLSDLLRAVRLRAALFYYIEGSDPWVAEAPRADEIISRIMPGAEHMIEFHVIVRGSCWAAIKGEPPVLPEEGDVIRFPQGDAHVLSTAPGMRAGQVDVGVYFTPRPPQLPFSLNVSGEGVTTAQLDGGGQSSFTVACGFLGCDARPFNPLRPPCRVCWEFRAWPTAESPGSLLSCTPWSTSRTAGGPAAKPCWSA